MTWLWLLLGCAHPAPPVAPAAPVPSAMPELTVRAQMNHHFAEVLALEERVIAGDLAGARAAGTRLAAASVAPQFPGMWRPWLADAKSAGERAAWAENLEVAAIATADAMAACGECHRGAGAGPNWEVLARPDAPAMDVHQYGVNWMGYGLVGPSDEAWTRGADALLTSPMHATGPEGLEARVRFLASEAKAETDPAGRARLWGLLLVTCGSCHAKDE